jgi:starch phosphorylase
MIPILSFTGSVACPIEKQQAHAAHTRIAERRVLIPTSVMGSRTPWATAPGKKHVHNGVQGRNIRQRPAALRSKSLQLHGQGEDMKVHRLIVSPDLPDELAGLRGIAMNLWYSWNPEVSRLFQALDTDIWESCGHNPVQLLSLLSYERCMEIVQDPALMDRIREAETQFERYISNTSIYSYNLDRPIDYRIAYFSMEYGLAESLPIYSGGLGILSGDHLKSASNLSFPLIAVGLLYQKGYFKQYLNADGWQQESYPVNDFYNLPLTPVADSSGRHSFVEMDIIDTKAKILIWKVQVGRVPLYLLDTSSPENPDHIRKITSELYGGDIETRIQQEIVLGIGGARALHQMGVWPFVYHLNEGHAAFAALERIRQSMVTYRVPFDVALESVSGSTVFTTHTPVPAGIDLFPPDLFERYFRNFAASLGMSVRDLLSLGRENPDDEAAPLSMAVLALRMSRGVNAVSKLHSHVSRRMWSSLWPQLDETDVPIGYVTNGVHVPSYVSKDLADLFARYLGEKWIEEPDNEKLWSRVYNIPAEDLWRVHETRRERLVAFCRARLVSQLKSSGSAIFDMRRVREYLNPEALTIAFARRFAPYKRATLLFSDPDRLLRIVSDKRRPVQFVFAGKAHPADRLGKELIKRVVHESRSEGFRRKLVFLENYDINMARYFVQGVDVWLNNPRRPNEACGTSGMKAAANGALNLSILDGWWPEAYDGTNGWAIGRGEELDNSEAQDRKDAEALYDLLEQEVIPLFFDRGPDGNPHGWIEMMKNSMAGICRFFNSHRMVEEYMTDYYVQAGQAHQILNENRFARARELRDWKQRIRNLWGEVSVQEVTVPDGDSISLGKDLRVSAIIRLGGLDPDETVVDLCHGNIENDSGRILDRSLTVMTNEGKVAEGVYRFTGVIPCEETGIFGYMIRVLPFHPYLSNLFSMNLITWG